MTSMLSFADSATSVDSDAPVRSSARQAEIQFQALKQELHSSLVESLDLMASKGLDEIELRDALEPFISQLVAKVGKSRKLSPETQQRLVNELPDEMFGAGPLMPLLSDPDVADILVNHPHEVFIETNGHLHPTEIVFANEDHLVRIIKRIASQVGRRIDEVSPMVDARLEDGSRVNAVIPPLALDGPKLSIRRFGQGHMRIDQLVDNGTVSQPIVDFLQFMVANRQSILVSGGTGSGKTTFLNALSVAIPQAERIVTIEDAAELRLQHPHVARMETRPANSEGAGEYTQRDLVRNALRMRPDRIIVGEVRGNEVLDMLQAMNTGHEGSLTTIHANDCKDAIARLEMMVAMTGLELPTRVVRSYISSGIGLVVHLSRLPGGERRLLRVSELENTWDGSIQMNDVFFFERNGMDQNGRSVGQFKWTGHEPKCLQSIIEQGVEFDRSCFSDAAPVASPSPNTDRGGPSC